MKCHYEVLEISKEADDSEIKSAYRKLALKWHPDKNLNDTAIAKEQFQLVQQAYEVLSDRQERAWYDKHKEQILHGSNSDYKDNHLDVFQYFTTTCFKGYEDDEKGFYYVYGNVFDQIAKEDFEHAHDQEQINNIPKFGNSQCDYEETVAPFYDYWMSYSTKKSYVWLDPHDIKEATNRKIFKLIEKENDKIRQKAKKERNEEVRSLVAFVRKRDKRVQLHIKNLEAKKIENREKQKHFTKQKRLERIKQLNESSGQAEWMKFDNVKTELEELEKTLAAQFGDISDSEDSDSSEDLNNLYCVACNKIFKTPKAFMNHESSKKHRENIENLRAVMNTDNYLVDDHVSNTENGQFVNNENISSDEVEQENEISISGTKSKKRNKKGKSVIQIVEHNSDTEVNNGIVENNDFDGELKSTKKQKRKKRKDKQIRKDGNEIKNDQIESVDNLQNQLEDVSNHIETDKDKYCAKCKMKFSSKNKLFEHLKKTGHSCNLNSDHIDKNRKRTVKQR